MNKFKIGDKVKLKYPVGFDNFDDEWKKWWYDNKNIIFIVYSVAIIDYILKYPNNEIVMSHLDNNFNATFFENELELYTNPLPDELFEL